MQITSINVDHNFRELQEHGTSDFPLQVYEDDLALYDQGIISWHWHPEVELAYVLEGSVKWTLNQETIILKPGEGLFINAQVMHSVEPIASKHARMISVVFDPTLVATKSNLVFHRYIQPILQKKSLNYVLLTEGSAWQRDALDAISQIHYYSKNEPVAFELAIIHQVTRFWLQLLRSEMLQDNNRQLATKDRSSNEIAMQRLKDMMTYIHQHYAEVITLQNLADIASISSSECQRCFKQFLSLSPIQYLIHYRLEVAAKYLGEQAFTVSQIALKCGFESHSYFSKQFKEKYNLSPTAYRKHIRP